MSEYNADHYLKKFGPIHGRLWCVGQFTWGKKHCALGHCGADEGDGLSPEALGLKALFTKHIKRITVAGINDHPMDARDAGVPQSNCFRGPRARIMAALRIIKAKGG